METDIYTISIHFNSVERQGNLSTTKGTVGRVSTKRGRQPRREQCFISEWIREQFWEVERIVILGILVRVMGLVKRGTVKVK
jgi:hypothetical protein